MTITVNAACVKVAAPLRTSKVSIHRWVSSKQSWVRKKIAEQEERLAEVPARRYGEGELWPYLGGAMTLRLANGARAAYLDNGHEITLTLSSRSRKPREVQVAELMSLWYRGRAQIYLEQKSLHFAEVLGVGITAVKLRLTKSKWGHCTPQGELQYNWLIMQAPIEIVDYLVAHEVSHRVHLNHSPAFWRTVAKICPDYQAHRCWLRSNGHTLVF